MELLQGQWSRKVGSVKRLPEREETRRGGIIPTLILFAETIFGAGYMSFFLGSRIASLQNSTVYLSGLLNLAFLFVFIIALFSFGPAMAASSPLTVGDTETLMASPVNEETLLVGKVFTFLTLSNPYLITTFLGAFAGLIISGLASPTILLMGPLIYHLAVLSASWISSSVNFYMLKHFSRGVVTFFWITLFVAILLTVLSTVLRMGLDIGSMLSMLSYSAESWWLLLLPSTYAARALVYCCIDVQLFPVVIHMTVLLGVFALSWFFALRSVKGIFFKTISEAQISFSEKRRTFGYATLKGISLPKAFGSLSGRLSEDASVAIFLEKKSFFRGILFIPLFSALFPLFIFISVIARTPLPLGSLVVLLLMGLASFEAILLGMSSATAISQEGKNIWIVLSSPISLEQYLVGKCYFYLLVNSIIQFVAVIVIAIFVKIPFVEAFLVSLASVFSVVAITGVGQWIGAKYATFESFEMNIASQSIQMGGALPVTGGIIFFLSSFLIVGANMLLPVSLILLLKDTLAALFAGLLYSIIVNLVVFNFFIKRAGRTLAKREYLVTA